MAKHSSQPDIVEVETFWNDNPLCGFEAPFAVGTKDFFDWHHATRQADEGRYCEHLYEFTNHRGEAVLDVGCGVGWLVWNFAKGGANVTGIDLSQAGIDATQARLRIDGLPGTAIKANAEALPFEDGRFDFVTSAGVLHHTPNTERAVREILRVLKPGGRAMISLYYRNWVLSRPLWPVSRFVLHHVIGAIPGRQNFRSVRTVEDFARLFDGDENPIGRIYRTAEFRRLFEGFNINRTEVHYFPARFLPFKAPLFLRKILDRWFGLMIYAQLTKPSGTAS